MQKYSECNLKRNCSGVFRDLGFLLSSGSEGGDRSLVGALEEKVVTLDLIQENCMICSGEMDQSKLLAAA